MHVSAKKKITLVRSEKSRLNSYVVNTYGVWSVNFYVELASTRQWNVTTLNNDGHIVSVCIHKAFRSNRKKITVAIIDSTLLGRNVMYTKRCYAVANRLCSDGQTNISKKYLTYLHLMFHICTITFI